MSPGDLPRKEIDDAAHRVICCRKSQEEASVTQAKQALGEP